MEAISSLSFGTSQTVYVNAVKFSPKHTSRPPLRNQHLWSREGYLDRGMTNDGWFQFNYTLRVSLICGWVERNEAFQYRTQPVELRRYIFVIFQTQIWRVCERTVLLLSAHPFVVFILCIHRHCFSSRLWTLISNEVSTGWTNTITSLWKWMPVEICLLWTYIVASLACGWAGGTWPAELVHMA